MMREVMRAVPVILLLSLRWMMMMDLVVNVIQPTVYLIRYPAIRLLAFPQELVSEGQPRFSFLFFVSWEVLEVLFVNESLLLMRL